MEISYKKRLENVCNKKRSRLCIGLDFDLDTMINPKINDLNSLNSFILDVIDSTVDICSVYKPNFAFYEKYGPKGLKILENIINQVDGKCITIADAKRGDIGNTSKMYAQSIFKYYNFDAVTIAPYMGSDSIEPFLLDKSKGAYILCLTSNQSAKEFQYKFNKNSYLYQDVAKLASDLNYNDNVGLVVGATNVSNMESIKKVDSSLTWLVPGIGFQGGDLEQSVRISNLKSIGIINVSRGIIYSGNQSLDDIRLSAIKYNNDINRYIYE